ncbi:Extended synaptotagmin-1 [Bagarius yarrelli]|uniref:Extended synaptotagmin-1 n=1 Tax=Bagarius yarrelli TaxID=175774 RepID=A0A556V8K4_BAGYA|nr:Extended synaptotagmin-1 [Bagarius yarrelli]
MSEKDTGASSSSKEQASEPKENHSPSPPARGIDAVGILWTFGKCLTALLPVYLAGYYRVSGSLVVFGLALYSGWKHSRQVKEARLRSAIQLLTEEQESSNSVYGSRKDLPAWTYFLIQPKQNETLFTYIPQVNFPDVEKVEWLNKVIQQAWPYIGQYLEKLLTETIAPSIRASTVHLQTLSFTKIDFGDKAMKVVGVKAHTENEKGQVLLDVYISYVGNVEINVEVKRYFCKAGVKGIQLSGMMRVILEPLIGNVPIVGAITMFFIRRPKLDINWTGLTNLLDIPGLNLKTDTMIMDAIASFLVLPNRLTIPLVPDLPVAQLRSPLPRGVVRIHLLEAEGLAAKDNYVKGVMSGLSDPYALIRVGPQTFRSRHKDNTDSPKWGEIYEVIVHEVPGQELEVELYDKDPDQDDFLGRTKMDLGIVKKATIVDEWFTLKDTPTGRVHLRLEWLTLQDTTDTLEQVIKRNKTVLSNTADPPSSAILTVYLDKAEELPMKKDSKDPSPMVQLSVQDITRESKTCWNTINPVWEDAFTFFIQDPHKQDIDIQVKDNDRVQPLGSLSLPLSQLIASPQLSLDQWFQLNNSGPASRIYINAILSVLWIDENVVASSLLSNELSSSRPQHTSTDDSFATEGVLRIHLLGGQNLIPKDNLMGGMVKGKSDPYTVINIGGSTFKSCVIKENLNPTWNEMFEVVLTDLPGQDLSLEVLDKDMDMKDDFMGRLKIKLSDIIESKYMDGWFTLSDVKHGRIHLALEWLDGVTKADKLEQVLQCQSKSSYVNKAVPAVALLFVYLEAAHDIPVCDRTSSPQWNEAFYFLVNDPKKEELVVKLSHCWDFSLGSVVIPIRELLSQPNLLLDQWLNLEGASPQSQILLRAQLKILCPKVTEGSTENTVPTLSAYESTPEKKLTQKSSELLVPITITSSVIASDENGKVKEKETEKESKKLSEDLSSIDIRPPHTSTHPDFGKEGVLRIHLLEAENLIAKDNHMGGMVKGKSDPYVKVNIGNNTFKSHVIKENLNPTWNEMYELVLTPESVSEVFLEVFDKDIDKDDFLGRCHISLQEIIQAQYIDQWFTLEDVKHGCLHLLLEWVPTVAEPNKLQQILKGGKEPKAGAELVVGGTSYKTKLCDRSTSPNWDESFHFLIHDPREDILIIKLFSGWDQPLGSLILPLKELLSHQELMLDQWQNLDGASPESQILLRAQLKILASNVKRKDEKHPETFHGKSVEKPMDKPTGKAPESYDEPLEKSAGITSPTNEQSGGKTTNNTEQLLTTANKEIKPETKPTPSFHENTSPPAEKNTEVTHMLPQHTSSYPGFGTQGVLRIHLLEAQNLIAMDSLMGGMVKGKSDPYVKITVGTTAFKSHVIKENLNPTWNEMYEMILIPDPKLEVKFELYDKDIDSDDFLGRFKIKLEDIIKSQYNDELSSGWDQPMGSLVLPIRELLSRPELMLDQWLSLDGALAESQILLRAELRILNSKMAALLALGAGPVLSNKQTATTGQIRISLSYQRKFIVTIHGCRGLVTSSKEGLDTYVSLILLPDKSKATKRKTAVKKKDLNPEFNERFEFDISVEDARQRALSVCVKHNSSFMSRDKDIIGQVEIDLGQIDFLSSVTEW